ncbi:MAG: 4'-phosphopantetheinyl transferase superfamily protein [Lachnospiraceae bacterium]|nr:4'-phosphopantetheinyl transferase superfamily protein [Lachnospiraceae bacterium]
MWETCYFLNIGNLTGEETAIVREMEALLDQERLLKYQRVQAAQGSLLSLGAGALLRLAVMEYLSGDVGVTKATRRLTPKSLLSLTEKLPKGKTEPILYRYGEQGKPYFENIPLKFSLSHSGSAVMLAVSESEIGADLQEIKQTNWEKLSERFYAEEEKQRLHRLLEKDPERAREEFFRLWCLKEAYGKWSGEGVTPYLAVPLMQNHNMGKNNLREGRLSWGEKSYRYAVYQSESAQQ